MKPRTWKNADKLRAELHKGLLRVPPDVACTCELGAPGISDGALHGPSCAIVVAWMRRDGGAVVNREAIAWAEHARASFWLAAWRGISHDVIAGIVGGPLLGRSVLQRVHGHTRAALDRAGRDRVFHVQPTNLTGG